MESTVELRERMRAAVRRAVEQAGVMRNVSGVSLVALLCAGALAPVAATWAVAGPLALAWAGMAGSVGAGVLTEVVDSALEKLRKDGEGQEPGEELVGEVLAARLERVLVGADASGAALRETASGLLRELDALHILLEHTAGDDRDTQLAIVAALADLGSQFGEFAFVAEDVRRALWDIDAQLRGQRAQLRAQGERSREQSMVLSQVLEAVTRGPRGETDSSAWPGCPYLGLVPFSRDEARVFYGRRNLTRRLVQALAERLEGGGLLLVSGPSGAGKSSLLHAGLVPALARDVLAPGSGRWPCRILTPTASPLRELAAHLADLAGRDAATVFASLQLDPARAAHWATEGLRAALGPRAARDPNGAGARLMLVLDQFEELFTLTAPDPAGRSEQAAFLDALDALAAKPACGPRREPAALVVAAVRGDFMDQALAHPALARAQDAGTFVVGPMTEEELRQAVTGPAAEAGLSLDPTLVEEVMREVRDQADQQSAGSGLLPLLSQVMAATWDEREGKRLTLLAYRRAGGLADAVDQGARAAYRDLPEGAQAIARSVFLRLTLVTADGRVARRPCGRAEIYRAAGQPAHEVDAVLEVFAARRLLVLQRESVEIAHDVLLRSWGELRDWLAGDRADQVLYGQIATDAELWEQHRRDGSYLYGPARVAEVDAAAGRWAQDAERYPPLPQVAAQFLAAGRGAARAGTRRRRIVIAALSTLTAAALLAAGLAVDNAAATRAQHDIALSRQLAAESLSVDPSDPLTARQLAAAAWSVDPTTQADAAMTTLLNEQEDNSMLIGHSGAVTSVAFAPSGTILASAGTDGTVRLWNPVTGREIGDPITAVTGASGGVYASPGVYGVAFNPAGTILASADSDGTVRLWNPVTGREIGHPITAETGAFNGVNAVAFNPAGTILASVNTDGTVRLWNPITEREIGRPTTADPGTGFGGTGMGAVAFNPAGTILASAGVDGTVELWNPATGREIGSPINAGVAEASAMGKVTGVAFNPAGTILATADVDGTVVLWNPATGREIGSPITADTGALSDVYAVAFNPAGTVLASADVDGTVELWNPATEREIGSPITADTGASGGVYGVAFNPAGTVLASADGDGTVQLWNPDTGKPVGAPVTVSTVYPTGSAPVSAVAFNPAGTVLASADGGGAIELWNPAAGEDIGAPIPVDTSAWGGVYGVAFNPAGTVLASADGDGTVRLWNPATGREIGNAINSDVAEASAMGGVYGVAFNPAGTVLASADGDGTVQLWNPATGREIGHPITADTGASGGVNAVAFNPAGTVLASADADGTVRLWNPATGREIGAPITADTSGYVYKASFNPAGTILASGESDGTVRLWNPATGREIGDPITADSGAFGDVYALAFNPAGTLLASADENGTIQLWQLAFTTNPHQVLCLEAGAPDAHTWEDYAAGEAEPAICD